MFKVIRSHRDRYQSKARVRFPISDSRTVSELSQLKVIVQISDTLRFRATLWLWGLRNNVRCSSWAH